MWQVNKFIVAPHRELPLLPHEAAGGRSLASAVLTTELLLLPRKTAGGGFEAIIWNRRTSRQGSPEKTGNTAHAAC